MSTHPFEIPFPPRLPDDPVARGWMLQVKDAIDARFKFGSGAPEGIVTANLGCIYQRTDGAASTSIYIKTADDGAATGWTAK